MKSLLKILLVIALFLGIFSISAHAGVVDIPNAEEIKKVSNIKGGTGDIVEDVNSLGFSILRILKVILQGLLVIYVVYIGVSMIISMGTDEDRLSKSKTQIYYSLIALVFINIPGAIYLAIKKPDGSESLDGRTNGETFVDGNSQNLFFNSEWIGSVIPPIVSFLEIIIFGVAIFVLLMAGIKIMTSRGRDERITEAKNKILYSIFALIFVGFIEAWKQFAIQGDLSLIAGGGGDGIFSKAINLTLLFAGPVAIFFLTLAGYYYITSNGDEERTKKAKNIIINTLIAIVLLVVMITFLNDLITL